METEIELNVRLTPALTEKVRNSLSGDLELVPVKAADKFSLRHSGFVDSSYTIDEVVNSFVIAVESIAPLLYDAGGVVGVGVFFSEGEAAAFSVLLSNKTVQMLASRRFAIDVTCYPCL
jgi:hypothetical protein